MKTRALTIAVAAAVAILAGYWASHAWHGYQQTQAQRALHAELASIRTYEEAFALRNDHYLYLPDSCVGEGLDRWRELGKAPPRRELGCFWVTSPTGATTAVTASTMAIVVENRSLGLRGIETDADREPTWTVLR